MKKKTAVAFVGSLLLVGSLFAHDLFLKFSTYFLAPNSEAVVSLINGTFDKSENAISRDRMLDVSIVGPEDGILRPDSSNWYDRDNAAWLKFKTGDAGTYVLGVSTAARPIDLSAEDFNEYLRHDGVLDVLEERKKNGKIDQPAREMYSKHVKAVFQVGDERTDSYNHYLNYPIEIVPQENPYELKVGDTFDVQVLLRGKKPVANQLVYASYDGHHGHDAEGNHQEAVKTRTDENGMAHVTLRTAGIWYIRLIHMVEHPDPDVQYESNWATLTFEVK